MSQIEITQIIEQIKQEITVDSNGHGKASIRATARLAGVSAVAVLKTLDSVNQEPSKMVQVLMGSGFDAVNLNEWRTNGIPDIAIAIILDYYAYEAGRYCTKQAKLICRASKTIGVRAWMQDITGWRNPATQPQEQPPTPALPPVEQRLHTLVLAMKTLAELTGGRLNPYMEQHFKDFAANLLAEYNRKLLTPSKESWLGVVNFAESELGRKILLK